MDSRAAARAASASLSRRSASALSEILDEEVDYGSHGVNAFLLTPIRVMHGVHMKMIVKTT